MMFRVTDLMIEAAAKKQSNVKETPHPCTRCTQCTKTGMSTCTANSDDGCDDCKGNKPSKKAKALADLHAALRETMMAQAY